MSGKDKKVKSKIDDKKVKFKIFDNRLNPDESYVQCLCCGAKASFSEEVDMIIRAPRKPSDLVRDL